MMQVLKKWKVSVFFKEGTSQVFWINDNFMSNVLRKVADMDFSENGLVQPLQIVITEVKRDE